jgi:hypothetical protein
MHLTSPADDAIVVGVGPGGEVGDMAAGPVPRVLAERLGIGATQGLVSLLASTRAEWTDEIVTIAAERFERRLTDEISALRIDVTRELSAVRQDFTRDLSNVRVELLKWSFLFWVGQVAATAGLLAYMLKP